ncbi:sigma 54-interacting transcriptional regulator [Gilvibacter sp.]|uniref:sigma 54-interacting transcriptional regulator n=1 Tax=Gilvibacter sp. TaxID=2729997 RepID=UPI003B52B46C
MPYFINKAQRDQFYSKDGPKLVLSKKSAEILAVNSCFENLTGYSEDELLKGQWALLEALNECQQVQFSNAVSNIASYLNKLLSLTYKNGAQEFVRLEIFPTKDPDYVFVKVSRDLSRQDIIDLFGEEHRFYQQFIHGLKDGVVITDKETKVVDVNEAYLKMTGIERDEILGTIPPYHWPPEFFEELVDLRTTNSQEDRPSFEATFFHKNGTPFPVSISISTIKDDEGEVTSVVTVVRDRSALSKSQKQLESEREFSARVINGLQEGLIVIDPLGKFLDANPAFLKMIGFDREEIIGISPPYPYWPPEHMDEIITSFTNIMDKSNKAARLTFMRKNGERFPALVSVTHLRDEKGEITAHVGSISDITDSFEFENKLKLANEFSESLINSLHEGLLVMDMESVIIDVNPAFCRMVGYDADELAGAVLPFGFLTPQAIKEFKSCAENVLKGRGFSGFESEFKRKDGSTFPVSVHNQIIRDKEGLVIAHFCTIQDISDQVRLIESQRRLTENSIRKKEAILELAGLVGSNYENALRRITSLTAEVLGVDRVSYWVLNKDWSSMKCKDLYDKRTGKHTNQTVFLAKDHPEYFDSLNHHKTIAVTNAREHKFTKSFSEVYLEPNGITSWMDVFIQGHDEDNGIIVFEHVGPMRIWGSEEEHFATSVASLVSLIIQSEQRMKAEKKLIELNNKLSHTVEELNTLKTQLEDQNVYLRKELDMTFNFEEMVYASAGFSDVLTNLEQVAPTTASVLLLGESGTGKELLARAVHNLSNRREQPFIKVNCGAIPRELIESELFGHKKGSFTGAIADKLGKVQLADGGTLFLDEIGELPLDMQPKLLRFLQEGELEMIGDPKTTKVDVRVIAATNRDLKEEVDKKRFREDLFFRLNVFPIQVPPLRERVDDIPVLIQHFVDRFSAKYHKEIQFISDSVMRKLKEYAWPGNVRELENLVERAVILSNSETLRIPEFETPGDNLGKTRSLNQHNGGLSLDEAQRAHILKALEQCQWKINGEQGAAKLLQLKPSTLRDRMKKLDIQRPV